MARPADHPGSIDQLPSGNYRIRLSVDGERHNKVVEVNTYSEAAEHARNWHEELTERAKYGLPTDTCFSDLHSRYEDKILPGLKEGTRSAYRDCLKPISTYFEDQRDDPQLARIRAENIDAYMAWRRDHGPNGEEREDPLSEATVAKDRRMLRRLFEYAERWEMRAGNPVKNTDAPKNDPREPVILSDGQYERLTEEAEKARPMLGCYVVLLGEAGLRPISEALWLRWEDLDLDGGFVWVSNAHEHHRTKSGEGRWVPLTSRLHDRLRQHAADFRLQSYSGHRTPWLFHNTVNVGKVEPGDRRKDFRGPFNDAADEAGLPDRFVRYDLRHRRATTWLAEGKSPQKVKEAMGHSTVEVTTETYSHLVRDHLTSLVEETGGSEEKVLNVLKLLLEETDGGTREAVEGLLQ